MAREVLLPPVQAPFGDPAPGETLEFGRAPRPRQPFELRHVPALDGLRGLAVAGVLVFHGGYLPGGYLGVDLFFVLSGFLITSLLLRERLGTGRIDLANFWGRRARRLLPAVFGLLLGVTLYALVWASTSELDGLRADTLATVFYAANWRAILSGHGYWDLFKTPSPLQHTWSLAIEEQFYVLWPMVVLGLSLLAARARRHPGAVVLTLAGAGAVVSWAWMAAGYTATSDTSRWYFGTDTRAGSILAGAALAALLSWRGWGPRRDAATPWVWGPSRVALEAAAGLAALVLAVLWLQLPGEGAFLYRGGFVLSAAAVLVLIAAGAHPQPGAAARALAVAPLRGLGIISYGLYLWHWPVFVVLQRHHTRLGIDGVALLAVKLTTSLALALVSFVVIERPIRSRGFAAWGSFGRSLMPAAALASVAAVLLATMGATPAPATLAAPAPPSLDELPAAVDDGLQASGTTVAPPAGTGAVTGPLPRPPGRNPRLYVVGDSVAADLAAGIDQDRGAAITVAHHAVPGCSPSRTAGLWRVGAAPPDSEPDLCRDWPTAWREAIAKFKPDAVLMHFGGPALGELLIGDGWFGPCRAVFTDHLRAELDAAVEVLTARGATLFIAPPAFHSSPYFAESINDNVACVNKVYRQVAESHRDVVRLIPLDTWTCPRRGACVEEIDGVTLREDGTHFHDGGRKLVAQWAASQLFSAPTAR